jgi:hypothetical protein
VSDPAFNAGLDTHAPAIGAARITTQLALKAPVLVGIAGRVIRVHPRPLLALSVVDPRHVGIGHCRCSRPNAEHQLGSIQTGASPEPGTVRAFVPITS